MRRLAFNAPRAFVLADWSFGWDISTNPLNLDKRALSDCKNFNLTVKGGLEKRRGMEKLYGASAGASIRDLFEYKAPDGTTYLLAAVGDTIMSYYGSAWHTLKFGLSATSRLMFVVHQGACYGTNGVNANFKLYNTTSYQVGVTPPGDALTVTDGGAGTLSGKYAYVFGYKRDGFNALVGNPSVASTALDLTNKKFHIHYTASTDPQVTRIVIYRTLNLLGSATDPTAYFKVTEVANSAGSYDDETADADLTTELEIDNTIPPLCKFIVLHKDRLFYINCPDATDGGSLVMWSKAGIGEAVPTTNYQYFDRKDGEDITGAASVGDVLVIFKRNKIFVLEGDLASAASTNTYAVARGVGCIAPWAVLPFENKVIFLSEEGWKAFDGVDTYDLSKSINKLCDNKYISINQAANYSAAYYPVREQFLYLANITSLAKRVFAGQFVVPLLYVNRGIPDEKPQNIVAWTYHSYPNHTLTCLAQYTDIDGITRVIAGDSGGYIYKLDTGTSDAGYSIPYRMRTGWLSCDTPPTYHKTLRVGAVDYVAGDLLSTNLTIERDMIVSPSLISLTGMKGTYCGYCYCGSAYCGLSGGINERVIFPGQPGRLFMFGIEGDDETDFQLNSIVAQYRIEGTR